MELPPVSSDKKLSEFFSKFVRQAPHSQEHKLGVIVPFRDGCSAMSQVCVFVCVCVCVRVCVCAYVCVSVC